MLGPDGQQLPGIYATGWIKRGPIGLIGHTKSDALETIGNVIADQANWWQPSQPEEASVVELLAGERIKLFEREDFARIVNRG